MNMHIYHNYVIAMDELRSEERTGQARFAHHRPVKSHTPKPVTVSILVPHARPDVFTFLDVISNHEAFTNHMLFDWSYSGPSSGLGAKARARSKAGMRIEAIDIEVVASHPPVRTVERNVSAGGRRVGTGTYTLLEHPHGGTEISFTYMWLRAPLLDRAFAPMVRWILRRGNERALERLAEQLARAAAASEATGASCGASLGEPTGLAAIEQTMLRHLLTSDRGSPPQL
jgi:hypothetical protein